MLTWRPIHIWSSISCTKIKLRIWRTSQIPQFHLAHLTMIFCTIRLWFLHQSKLAVDGLFLRTSEVVVKNMVCSIHCLGNNDGFKQLLLENISSAKMSEAARLSYKTQSLCCTRDAGGHISIHNWNWQKHLGKEQIKKKKTWIHTALYLQFLSEVPLFKPQVIWFIMSSQYSMQNSWSSVSFNQQSN